MYRIKWKNQRGIYEGLSNFLSEDAASEQVDIWKEIFRSNRYYIIPIR